MTKEELSRGKAAALSSVVGAHANLCEEDAHHVPQWLAEAERLNMPFVVYLDRCSEATKRLFKDHPLCCGWTEQDDPAKEYTEQAKQHGFDLLDAFGFRWGLIWDIDETWDRDAPAKFAALTDEWDYMRAAWVNTWGDAYHIRVDKIFAASRRPKLYRFFGMRWVFDHPITYGCKLVNAAGTVLPGEIVRMGETDLVCLHHGLQTRALREFHKERWDRIYTTAVGNNPYHFWDHCLDETNHPPVVIENPYL